MEQIEIYRIGVCKHTNRKILQLKDEYSDDAIDEKGWFCLHDDNIETEIQNIFIFIYNLDLPIINN